MDLGLAVGPTVFSFARWQAAADPALCPGEDQSLNDGFSARTRLGIGEGLSFRHLFPCVSCDTDDIDLVVVVVVVVVVMLM